MKLARSDTDIFNALHPEKGATWLPGHWLAKRLNRPYTSQLMLQLRILTKEGYLRRDWPKHLKNSKHSSYARTEIADALLNEQPRRSRTDFKHQILEDMDTASIQFGVDADKRFRLERMHDILTQGADAAGVRQALKAGENSNYIRLPSGEGLVFDGKGPLKLSTATEHQYTLLELDRDTEGGHNFSNQKRRTIHQKIVNIKEFVDNKIWKSHYGLDRIFIRWVTINETRAKEILDIIEEVNGPCKHQGVAAWRDWANHEIAKPAGQLHYPPIYDGETPLWDWDWSFTTPYKRVGFPDYYLNKFYEMDR